MATREAQHSDAVSDVSLLTAVSRAIDVLHSSPETASYFNSVIDWLVDRRETWSRRSWRVGLIGITSSGKSSLVNALLNERLLPVAVRPSSNSLVVCRRGPEPKAVVHYHDREADLIRAADLRSSLETLTDERTNPENELGVKEIELETPGFQLGERIALVDTPGLDAYGLEKHEQLTIELLLPTVDVAVFLTTAKANADRQISNHLATIEGLGKPVVLVQNMIDSIEPKLGIDGRVEKTREQVAQEHHQRLRRLLRQAIPRSEMTTPIVQVSAKAALENRREESGLPRFVEAVEAHLRSLAPRLGRARRTQLREFLSRCEQQESGQTEVESRAQLERAAAALRQVETALIDFLPRLDGALRQVRVSGGQQQEALREKAEHVGVREVEAAEEVVSSVTDWRNGFAGKVIDVLSSHREDLQRLAAELSLRPEDFAFRPPAVRKFQSQTVLQKVQKHTYSVEKPGLWNWVKRKVGASSGYEERTKTWREVEDLAAFRNGVASQLDASLSWFDMARDGVVTQLMEHQDRLHQEVIRQRDGVKARLASRLAAETRLQAIARLKPIIESLRTQEAEMVEESQRTPDAPATGFDQPRPVRTLPAAVTTLLLAQKTSRKRFLRLREVCQQRAEARRKGAQQRVMLWAWDRDALEAFAHRYWFDCPRVSPPVRPGLQRMPGATSPQLVLGGEYGGELDAKAARPVLEYLSHPATVFLLLDLEQPGSTRSHLDRSPLRTALASCQGLVLVIQSVGGLQASTHLVEAIGELKRTVAEFGLQPVAVIANSSSIGLSLLIDELWASGNHLKTLDDEQHWIRRFADLRIGMPAVDVPGMVRSWRDALATDGRG